ncbi:MAG: hypothetical protein P8J37_20295 [Fuerstiella sp.]|nr:hypothetical protein [Fuerstiella sp.]
MDDPYPRDWMPVLKTKPLSLQELGNWFDISPRHIGPLLRKVGAERIGRRWRVPVREMPPEYLLDVGLVIPSKATPDVDGHLRIDARSTLPSA